MKPLDISFIFLITLHWAFSMGMLFAVKTTWSIPRFILICLLGRYLIMSYGY